MEKINTMLARRGEAVKKYLFLYGLTASKYNASKVCQKLCISKYTLDMWIAKDLEFARLIDEVQWHMKNFFESKLMQLVKAGNPVAVVMVNKTRNKDRGYGEKLEVEHTGNIGHNHRINLEELNLPNSVMRVILDAMEAREKASDNKVVDAKGHEVLSITDVSKNGKKQ